MRDASVRGRFRRVAFPTVGFLFALVVFVHAADIRTWTDSSGKFKIQAKLVAQDKGKVTLEKEDGTQFEIDLKKLSPVDQKYIADLKEPEDDPFKPKKPMPKKEPSAAGEPELTEFDGTAAKLLALVPTKDEWKIELPNFEPIALANRGIPLPARRDFFEKGTALVVSPSGKQAAISYYLKRPGDRDGGSTRLILCDLENGKTLGSASSDGQMVVMALADNGTDLLVRKTEFGFGKSNRLERWSINGDVVKRGTAWLPHSDEKWEPNRDVTWASYLGDKRVATLSGGGQLTVWDLDPLKPLYIVPTGNKSAPALSPDGKFLAFGTGRDLAMLDVASSEIIAMKATPNLTSPALAFSPSGARIAAVAANRLYVWDTASGELYREMQLLNLATQGTPVFTSEQHVLLGNQFLIDLETQVKLWQYTGGEQVIGAGGVCWFHVSEGDRAAGALVPLKLPHAAAIDLLKKGQEDPNFFVLKPGTSVKIDVSKLPADQQEKVIKALTSKLEANGAKVGDDGSITLSAWTEPGQQRDVSYRSFGPGFGGPPGFGAKTYKVKEHFSKIRFTFDGQSVYETAGGGIPFIINLKEGETVEQHLKKLEKPNYAYFDSVELPKLLTKSQGNKVTLGASRVSPAGLR